MAVRPLAAVAAVALAGALGLGALGWASGALAGDDDQGRCRGRGDGYGQPPAASSDPRG